VRLRKFLVASLVSVLSFSSLSAVSAANPKPGNSCSSVGKKQVYAGKTFTCVKAGKKLVWNKGVVVKAAPKPSPTPTSSPSPTISSVPTPEPTPIPSPTISASPTATPIITDQVSPKGVIVYGIKETQLMRQSALGTFFTSDSRDVSSFDPIRRAAYNAVNTRTLNMDHPKVELEYVTRPSFPKFLIPYVQSELKYAAAFWNDVFDAKIKVKIYLVTEKDRDFVDSVRWLKLNLPDKFDRFDKRNERVFISGGAGFWDVDGTGKEGRIYLATASYLDTNYATNEWPQVPRHEFVHIVQNYLFRKLDRNTNLSGREFNNIAPQHLWEGSANTISYLSAMSNIGWASDGIDARLSQIAKYTKNWRVIKTEADVIEAMKATEYNVPEGAFEMGYPLGAIMYEWFIATYGMDGFIKLLKELSSAPSFDDAIRNAVGINKDTFYTKAAPYILSVFQRVNPYE
jgi:hypothetical protein